MVQSYLGLLGAIVLLTASFSFMIASANIEEIKNTWDKHRCQVPIMVTAGMFRPHYYTGTATQFAKENFEFCTKQIADGVIKIGFAPFFMLAKELMSVQNVMTGPLNSIRGMITKAVDTFTDYMRTQYLQYKAIIIRLAKTTHHLRFAMGRVQAITTALIYTFFSMLTLINNTVKFAMVAAWVFIGILAALIFFFWFGILPFLFIIVPLVAILVVADVQTDGWLSPFSNGGIASAFCVDPDANVILPDGSRKALKDLRVGDCIDGPSENRITGRLVVDASKESLVSIHGIRMSTTHRVLHNKKWILAKDHPEATPCKDALKELICLNTTRHSVPIATEDNGILYVGDWEEVDSWEGQRQWIDWVHMKLNSGFDKVHRYPTTVPLCGSNVQVVCQKRGWVSLEEIQIGDTVLGEKGWTSVRGVYAGHIGVEELPKYPDWISDGVWVKANRYWLTRGNGIHDSGATSKHTLSGLQLVTDDGTFILKQSAGVSIVRDFTEVGADAISESYSWLDTAINKKKRA
jgi:hypothetical protein